MFTERNIEGGHHQLTEKIKKLEEKILNCIKDCTLCKLECTHHEMYDCVKLCDLCIQSCNLYLSIYYNNIEEKIFDSLNMCLCFSNKCYEECKKHEKMDCCQKCAASCNDLISFNKGPFSKKKKSSKKKKKILH